MKVTYSADIDTLCIRFNTNDIEHTEESEGGRVLVDYDENEEVVGLEIFNASEHFASIPWKKQPVEVAA